MSDKLITLTLSFTTAEQAHHVLEAYHEAMGFSQNTGISVQHADSEQPVPPYSPPVDEDDDEDEPASVELDERGVPYHPDFHSGNKKISKGAWNRKRGHDRAAADAYEAGYLQARSPHAGNGMAPQVNAPAATILPLKDFQDLWVHCCHNHKVNMADQQHIEQTWGGHPMSAVFEDGLKRSQAYAFLQQKANA
jgi:hypothetical protein